MLAEQIRTLREKRGLTQAALASAVGVQREAIGRIEAGIRKPGPDLLEQLAAALGAEIRLVPTRKKS